MTAYYLFVQLLGQKMMTRDDIVKSFVQMIEAQHLYDPHNPLYAIGNPDIVNILGKIICIINIQF